MVVLNNRVNFTGMHKAPEKRKVTPYSGLQEKTTSNVSFGEGFTLRLIEKFFPKVKEERKELEANLKAQGKKITLGSKQVIDSTVTIIADPNAIPGKVSTQKTLITPTAAEGIEKTLLETTISTALEKAKNTVATVTDAITPNIGPEKPKKMRVIATIVDNTVKEPALTVKPAPVTIPATGVTTQPVMQPAGQANITLPAQQMLPVTNTTLQAEKSSLNVVG
ncbi:MAG: hypothetical protein AB7V50_02425 [Vampirovibrionia bacterium]